MANSQTCCAISKYTSKQCRNIAKFITTESLHVCRYHKDCKQEDIQTFNLKQEVKLKKKQEAENQKAQKEQIQLYNQTLLDKHPGEIPLRDKTGKIINFALVDEEDYDNVMKYTWHQAKQDNNLTYVQSHINGIKTKLHHFILGKPNNDNVIHHRDHNGLNNKRSNIVFASLALNNQHNFKKENCSSKYVGVSYSPKTIKKWLAQSSKVSLGLFSNEIDAAKAYDTYVYLKYGIEAHTNGLLNYDDVKDIDINTLIYEKKRDLPNNISTSSKNTFRVRISYNGNSFISFEPSLDKAKEKLKSFEKEIENIKQKEKIEHFQKPIIRNQLGQAILNIYNKKGDLIDNVPVDDDKWHELTQYSWYKTSNYYQANVDGKLMLLNRFLTNAKKGEIADHINDNGNTVNNHTSENLRINTLSGNTHNKKKLPNTSSQYIGVYLQKNRYTAKIIKNNIVYRLGSYKTETEAAIAYNLKAKALYNEFSNLNKIPQELLEIHQDEIITKLTMLGKL